MIKSSDLTTVPLNDQNGPRSEAKLAERILLAGAGLELRPEGRLPYPSSPACAC